MSKRFDVALEISKQLITLCSAMLVGVSALADSILTNEADGRVFTALVFLYFLLTISIVAGILHLGAITNLVEASEEKMHRATTSGEEVEFVSLFDSKAAPIACLVQQIFFLFSVFCLIGTLLIDRSISPAS